MKNIEELRLLIVKAALALLSSTEDSYVIEARTLTSYLCYTDDAILDLYEILYDLEEFEDYIARDDCDNELADFAQFLYFAIFELDTITSDNE